MNIEFLVAGLLWYVVFLLSTTCHEAAHAWVAMRGGDLTAYHGGQVSLDPIPHIRREPFGMVLFPILSYVMGGWMMGWASAPYDPHWAQRHPKRAAWMALAGPCANFTLALIAGILIRLAIATHTLAAGPGSMQHIVVAPGDGFMAGIATFLSLMFSLNLLLGCFNLIPIPPLDGFGVVGLFLSEDTGRRFQQFGWSLGMFTIVGLVIAWQIFEPLFYPIFGFSLRMLYLV